MQIFLGLLDIGARLTWKHKASPQPSCCNGGMRRLSEEALSEQMLGQLTLAILLSPGAHEQRDHEIKHGVSAWTRKHGFPLTKAYPFLLLNVESPSNRDIIFTI